LIDIYIYFYYRWLLVAIYLFRIVGYWLLVIFFLLLIIDC